MTPLILDFLGLFWGERGLIRDGMIRLQKVKSRPKREGFRYGRAPEGRKFCRTQFMRLFGGVRVGLET